MKKDVILDATEFNLTQEKFEIAIRITDNFRRDIEMDKYLSIIFGVKEAEFVDGRLE